MADSTPDPSVTVRSSRTAIYLQDACVKHQYIRSNDVSAIVERPERLRAVKIGLSAAIANLEQCLSQPESRTTTGTHVDDALFVQVPAQVEASSSVTDDLSAALQNMNIAQEDNNTANTGLKVDVVELIKSTASVDLLNNAAVKFVHGDIDGDVYLEKLVRLARESEAKVALGESEIPAELSQGDLYLCPGSLEAIAGALGTVCQAVDAIVVASRCKSGTSSPSSSPSPSGSPAQRAFVAIRPPGHHCGEDSPSGFCFVNNVAVAAAHAHITHGITKVVIFDIDLHHGNGTQSIAWQINEETYRLELEELEIDKAQEHTQKRPTKPRLKAYYSSIHDILSYPCEDGKPDLVQAASTSIHGPHGQYIENVHLKPYSSEDNFHSNLYPNEYSKILKQAKDFVGDTQGDEVLVFISCGFDACEHEYPSMSRHNRKVPVSFYHRFARDAGQFADAHARGKLVSVLEGGYSDRALMTGAMAHLVGLVDMESNDHSVHHEWWGMDNVVKLEKATKKRRGGRISVPAPGTTEKWLERTLKIFSSIETVLTPSSSRTAPPPPFTKTLRTRKTAPPADTNISATTSPLSMGQDSAEQTNLAAATAAFAGLSVIDDAKTSALPATVTTRALPETNTNMTSLPKKLPRVILRVRDPADTTPRLGNSS